MSPEAISRIDQAAADQGLSRNEYLRRQLNGAPEREESRQRMTMEHAQRCAYAARDLLDPEVMERAWR